MRRTKEKYEPKNLVVLVFADNECYTNVLDFENPERMKKEKIAGLRVNFEMETWSYYLQCSGVGEWENSHPWPLPCGKDSGSGYEKAGARQLEGPSWADRRGRLVGS